MDNATPATVATEERADGQIVLVTGSSGSGKTAWVRQRTRKAERALVWDVEGQYGAGDGYVQVRSVPELLERSGVLAGEPRPGRFAFDARRLGDFDAWCEAAWLWVQLWPGVIIAEELADVTNPGKAPDAWGVLVRRGRKYGAHVYAITQRPSESDKTVAGNAHVIHAGMMARDQDRAYIARELDVPVERVAALAPLEWLERVRGRAEVEHGRVTF